MTPFKPVFAIFIAALGLVLVGAVAVLYFKNNGILTVTGATQEQVTTTIDTTTTTTTVPAGSVSAGR